MVRTVKCCHLCPWRSGKKAKIKIPKQQTKKPEIEDRAWKWRWRSLFFTKKANWKKWEKIMKKPTFEDKHWQILAVFSHLLGQRWNQLYAYHLSTLGSSTSQKIIKIYIPCETRNFDIFTWSTDGLWLRQSKFIVKVIVFIRLKW